MSASLNQFTCIGNLTRDIELKYTPKGTAVAQGAVALSRTWKDEGGNKHEESTFIDFEAWGRTAEVISEYTNKGDKICLSGRIKQDTWEDKETGQKRSKLKLVVESMVLLGSKPKQEGQKPASKPASKPAGKTPPPADPDLDPADDDDFPM